MQIVEMGKLAGCHDDEHLPEDGIIIAATTDEVWNTRIPSYTDVIIIEKRLLDAVPKLGETTVLDEWNAYAKACVKFVETIRGNKSDPCTGRG